MAQEYKQCEESHRPMAFAKQTAKSALDVDALPPYPVTFHVNMEQPGLQQACRFHTEPCLYTFTTVGSLITTSASR